MAVAKLYKKTERSKELSPHLSVSAVLSLWARPLLAVVLVGNGKLFASVFTAAGQHAAAIFSSHT